MPMSSAAKAKHMHVIASSPEREQRYDNDQGRDLDHGNDPNMRAAGKVLLFK